jgi:hypothetical protein
LGGSGRSPRVSADHAVSPSFRPKSAAPGDAPRTSFVARILIMVEKIVKNRDPPESPRRPSVESFGRRFADSANDSMEIFQSVMLRVDGRFGPINAKHRAPAPPVAVAADASLRRAGLDTSDYYYLTGQRAGCFGCSHVSWTERSRAGSGPVPRGAAPPAGRPRLPALGSRALTGARPTQPSRRAFL